MADIQPAAAFDAFADHYDDALNQGLSLTGESKDYYAERRVQWLAGRLRSRSAPASPKVIDYGCGIGSTLPYLRKELDACSVLGLDVSEHELHVARKDFPDGWASFKTVGSHVPDESADVVYCNGTFHHIPPPQRQAAVKFLFDCLSPGGMIGLWENNPWNPGTRLVMSKIPFDHDAIMLTIPETRGRLRSAGFHILSTDTLFYFPKSLGIFRPLEKWLSALPLGGQYQVLAVKPRV